MRIGLIADTHVPYRAPRIPESALAGLRGVDAILHAGDVDEPDALTPLTAIAPTYAVRGNFHLLDRSAGGATFPHDLSLVLANRQIVVTHGHDLGVRSWIYKGWFLLRKLAGQHDFPKYDRAIATHLLRRFPAADVIVFGHTHRFYMARWGETLLVNPGAALEKEYFNWPAAPSVALLILESGSVPRVEHIPLC